MIDVRELKTRYDEIRRNIENRFMNVDLDQIMADQEKRAALMPAVGVIASVQACEALKIAAGKKCALQGKLFCADLLNSEFECIPFS